MATAVAIFLLYTFAALVSHFLAVMWKQPCLISYFT